MKLFVQICLFVSISIGVLILIIALPFNSDLESLVKLSQIYSNIFLGMGGVLAIGGGLTFVNQYLENLDIKQKISKLKRKYPSSEFGRTIKAIHPAGDSGYKWILDERENPPTRNHISNVPTLRDLEFNEMKSTPVPEDEFWKIKEGPYIKTRDDW